MSGWYVGLFSSLGLLAHLCRRDGLLWRVYWSLRVAYLYKHRPAEAERIIASTLRGLGLPGEESKAATALPSQKGGTRQAPAKHQRAT